MNHGATAYKSYGCRCDICKAANTEQMRDWRSRLGGHIPAHVHGSDTGYSSYSCRCDACRDAHSLRMRHYKRNRAQGNGS